MVDVLFGIVSWIAGALFAVLTWVLGTLFWILVWLVLPVAVVAFLVIRGAEKVFGEAAVRAWVKTQSMKFGTGAWARARRLLFALGALPVRVLVWFIVYAVWHAIVSLFWRPKWGPWQRAWGKRWKPPQLTPSGRPVKPVAAKAR